MTGNKEQRRYLFIGDCLTGHKCKVLILEKHTELQVQNIIRTFTLPNTNLISMNRFLSFHTFLLIILFASFPLKAFTIDAPVTTIGTYMPCPGTTVQAVVTVTGFNAVGSVTLRIEYDSTVMTFNPPPATFFNPALGGASINSAPAGGTLKKIMITWAGIPAVTLPTPSTLVTLSFAFIGGNTALAFNNESGGGGDCEYADASGIPMNDMPTSSFYFSGQVNSGLPGMPSPIAGPASPCQGSNASYSVTGLSGVSYAWTLPSGWILNSGQGTSSITTTVGSASGNITVTPTGPCGTGPSQSLAASVLPLPGACGAITGPATPCQGSTGLTYSVTQVANATGYIWTVPVTWTILSGQNTETITVTAGNLGGVIGVYATNPCGASNTSGLNVMPAAPPVANAGPNQSIGYGSSTTLNGSATGGSGNYTWHWEPAALLINPDLQNPVTVNLTASVQFTLAVTDATSSCQAFAQTLVTVTGGVLSVVATADPNPVCEGNPVQLLALVSGGTGNYTFSWTSTPPGFTSNLPDPTVFPIQTTRYQVVVNDGFATVSDSVTVSVIPMPAMPQKPAGPDTIDLQFTPTSDFTIPEIPAATSYLWELTPLNSGSISGTGTTGTVDWNPNYLGTATVRVKAFNQCGESAWSEEKQTLVDNTTSAPGLSVPALPEIYPNPNNGRFNIRIPGMQGKNFQLCILNNLGMSVYTSTPGPDEDDVISIDLPSLPAGMYLVVLTHDGIHMMRKVMIR
jgi:hypothetical protein